MKNISCIGVFGLMFAVPIGIKAQSNWQMAVRQNQQIIVNEQQRLNRFVTSSYSNYSSNYETQLKIRYNQLARIEERIKKLETEIASEEEPGSDNKGENIKRMNSLVAKLDDLHNEKEKVQKRIISLESSGKKPEKNKTDTLK